MTNLIIDTEPSSHIPNAQVRYVEENDIDEVICMLRAEFSPGISSATLHKVFNYDWLPKVPDRGLLLEVDGELAGYLGTIYSERKIGESVLSFCNISSWYVRPAFRGYGLGLLMKILGRKGQIITSFSPNLNSGPILKKCGFKSISTGFIVIHPKLALEKSHNKVRILTSPEDVMTVLANDSCKLVKDHVYYGCSAVALTDGSEVGLVIAKRRLQSTFPHIPMTEILHVSNHAFVRKNFGRIYLSLLWKDRVAVVAVDESIFGENTPAGWHRKRPRFFRGAGMSVEQIDSLYSELVLMF